MTITELDLIVNMNVEKTIKEFRKLMPAIRKVIKQMQISFGKVNTKAMTNQIKQTVQFLKKKITELKQISKNNEIKININNKDAKKKISQIQKEINSLNKKINARTMKINIVTQRLEIIRQRYIKEVIIDVQSRVTMSNFINNSVSNNAMNTNLLPPGGQTAKEGSELIKPIDNSNIEMKQLENGTSKVGVSQGKVNGFMSAFKNRLEQAKSVMDALKEKFNQMPNITKMIANNVKKLGSGLKSGLIYVLKLVGHFLNLRNVYNILSSSASTWLSSQNTEAQQLSANIEYMRYAMGSVFAPVIQYVVGLVYQLMRAIQSVVYAFSGVNIFAKATAASMGKAAGSAKQTSRSLAGIHSEINNVSENEDSDGGSDTISANMDLSQLDASMSPLSQALYEFFKPLNESWDNYGTGLIERLKSTASQIGTVISSVWVSFENIITNGTVYLIFENLLSIIGSIAEAFSNAWNYDGNGDAIIQNLADAFNNLLGVIDNVVNSPGFQEWLKNCSEKFREITEKIETIDWQPLIDVLSQIGEAIGNVALDVLSGLVDIFKWIAENPIVVEILLAIAGAITVISTVLSILSGVVSFVGAAMSLLTTPISLVILAIIALIAIIVAIVVYWNQISAALSAGWEWLQQRATEIFTAIGEFFANIWQAICDTATEVWNNICNFFKEIWEWIANIATEVWNNICNFFKEIWEGILNTAKNIWERITTTISGVINKIKETITNVLDTIKDRWNNIWNGIKDVLSNVWNGIWNTIKNVINSILGGIESMANGVINGVNSIIRVLNNLHFNIPDWIPVIGGKSFGFNINMIGQVSLPRLARGGIIDGPTIAMIGEYSGAKSNPEIVTPQNIMYDTMLRALQNSEISNNDKPIYLTVNVNNKKLGDILLENLRERKRQTGKSIEALVN